jgi:predicted nucleic acid-binding protein
MDNPELASIILDASCLLNLCASGKLKEIAETLNGPLVVSDYVLNHEVLFIRHKETEQDDEEIKPVNLVPLISLGLIKVISLNTEEEQNTFIDLATELDDGEAITISLAECQHCKVATDDRKALKVISSRSSTHSISTLEIIKNWVDQKNISKEDTKRVLTLVLKDAHFYPGERDGLYSWWRDIMS